jgi:hypothetical protein
VHFRALSEFQVTQGIVGGLLEIGAYKGRSTILMGFLQRPTEEFVVCDLFGAPIGPAENAAENRMYYAGLQLDDFRRNYLRFHERLPRLIVGGSADLSPDQLGGPFRLVHIDGSHLYEVVRGDLQIAKAVMCDRGVIALDDVRGDLGVTAAVWEAVAAEGLVPISYGDKMYATWSTDAAPRYVRHLATQLKRDGRFTVRLVQLKSRPVIEILWFEDRGIVSRVARQLIPPGAASLGRRVTGFMGGRRAA